MGVVARVLCKAPDVLSSLDADLVLLGQIDVSKIGAIEDAGAPVDLHGRVARVSIPLHVETSPLGFQSIEASIVNSVWTLSIPRRLPARATGPDLCTDARLHADGVVVMPARTTSDFELQRHVAIFNAITLDVKADDLKRLARSTTIELDVCGVRAQLAATAGFAFERCLTLPRCQRPRRPTESGAPTRVRVRSRVVWRGRVSRILDQPPKMGG